MHASSTVLLTDGDEITSHLELVIPFVAISNAGGTGGVITIGAVGEAPADTLDRLINALVALRNGIVHKAGGGDDEPHVHLEYPRLRAVKEPGPLEVRALDGDR